MNKAKCFLSFAVVFFSMTLTAMAFAGDWHIKGDLFIDTNDDLIKDGGEPDLPSDATISCTGPGMNKGTGGTETKSTKKSFDFDTHKKPGLYTLTATDIDDHSVNTPNPVMVTMEKSEINVNFGYDDEDLKKLSISGRVFEDKNCNGERKGGEKGLEGVTITLNPGAITTLTKHDGKYKFKDKDLPAGIYTVQETDPSGYCSTTPNTITVILVKKKVKNKDFGDHKLGVSPQNDSCCQ